MQDLINYLNSCISHNEYFSKTKDDFNAGMAQMARQILNYVNSRDFDPRSSLKFKEIKDLSFQDIHDLLSMELEKHQYSICETYPYLLQLPATIKPMMDSYKMFADYYKSVEPILKLKNYKTNLIEYKSLFDLVLDTDIYNVTSSNKWHIRINIQYYLDRDFDSKKEAEDYLDLLLNQYHCRRVSNEECNTSK